MDLRFLHVCFLWSPRIMEDGLSFVLLVILMLQYRWLMKYYFLFKGMNHVSFEDLIIYFISNMWLWSMMVPLSLPLQYVILWFVEFVIYNNFLKPYKWSVCSSIFLDRFPIFSLPVTWDAAESWWIFFKDRKG